MIFLHYFTLFGIDMHQNRSISLFSTPFDHFHFHPLVTLNCYPELIPCRNGCLPYEKKSRPHCIGSTSDTAQTRVRRSPNQAFGDVPQAGLEKRSIHQRSRVVNLVWLGYSDHNQYRQCLQRELGIFFLTKICADKKEQRVFEKKCPN